MKKNVVPDLKPLLSPRSVAIVGASLRGGYGSRFLMNLQNGGFKGKIYLVNPKYNKIGEMPCYNSLADLPEAVDLAAIIVSNRLVLSVLEQCVQRGVKAAMVISAGFAEAGQKGRIDQDAIRQLARRHGLLVSGPNCLGIANPRDHVMAHSYAEISFFELWPGNIGFVSQSGAVGFTTVSQALDRGISFSYLVSCGNEAALESIDFMRYLIREPNTRVICCFLEGLKEARRFLKVADEALEACKPIIAIKVGRSEVGSRQAISHTGSLTGRDDVYQAVFNQKRVIRVPDPDDLFEMASIFSRCPAPKGEGLSIVTTSGGMGSLLADKCGIYGLHLPPLSDKISKIYSETDFLLVYGQLINPVDIRGQGASHLQEILKPLIEDDRYHVLLVALGLPAVGEQSRKIAQDLIEIRAYTDKPLVVLWAGTKINSEAQVSEKDGFRALERSNIPIFYSPEKCIQAIRALVTYHRYRKRWLADRSGDKPEAISAIDEVGAFSFLKKKEGVLDELGSHKLLSFYGIPVPREKFAADFDEAAAAASEIGYPVVLKVLSHDLPHKTEVGGVYLSVSDKMSLKVAYSNITESVKKNCPGVTIRGVLVQEMISGGREMIVGFSHDDQFGPVLICGLGGIFVEIFSDVNRRVPPVTIKDAGDMVRELKGARILESFRGRPASDVPALLDVIVRIGRMALDLENRIAELEINPLIVKEKGRGACAVDALVKLKPVVKEISNA